ncbi:MAG: orotidine-5'-phosphate decarboxylase [Nitrospiria bacterium]
MHQISPKDRIILPLDFNSAERALEVVDELKDDIGMFKIGLTLFMSAGMEIVEKIQEKVGGDKVFLDIKFGDIPHTVGGVSSVVVDKTHVKFFTVDSQYGERVLKSAVDAMQNGTKVLAVTILTSLSQEESEGLGYSMSVKERVLSRADLAHKAGCAGVVCSGHEARAVKKKYGKDFIVVTPGIRPVFIPIPNDDQRRIMTPGEAIKNGSDYLVIGRPIIYSPNMRETVKRIVEEIETAL